MSTALAQHRTRIIDVLTSAFAHDRLDTDALEGRLERAEHAQTLSELDALILDLEQDNRALVSSRRPRSTALVTLPSPCKRRTQHMLAVMGGSSRRGAWTLRRRTSATAVMGGIVLDLRNATLPEGTSRLKLRAVMGGITLIVPPDLDVDVRGLGIMGHFGRDEREEQSHASQRRLVVRGFAIMGGVHIKTRP